MPGEYIVFMTTPSRLHQLVGRIQINSDGSKFTDLTTAYENNTGRYITDKNLKLSRFSRYAWQSH